jgi:hypothetical protein
MAAAPTPPTWNDIESLIRHVDEVCRESEAVRSYAERAMRRRDFWPDRRQPPRRHHHNEHRPPTASVP